MKAEYIRPKFLAFLNRRAIPRHLDNKADVQRDEIAALLRAVTAVCPDRNYQEWWPRFEDALDEAADYRTWPTVSEIRKASSQCSRGVAVSGGPVEFDTNRINADRIKAGHPVGDFWVYGRGAAELLESGLVTEEDLKPLRSKLFFAMVDVLGEEPALEREKAFKAHHAAAVEMLRNKTRRRQPVSVRARGMSRVNEHGEVVE
jgi:hypothetical protein